MQKKNAVTLRDIELFLLDLDGTLYLGDTVIDGAVEFVATLQRLGIRYLFVTNNSSRSAMQYGEKLRSMGFAVTDEQVLTSGQITSWYLSRQQPGARCYVVGTDSFKKELLLVGLQVLDGAQAAATADYVVAGFDTELTYEKLRIACTLLERGVRFVATNPDMVCPIGKGRFIPDCGSICMMLETATRRQPTVIGKPHTIVFDFINAERPFYRAQRMAVVGDRLATDGALACNASIMSICVLSGEASLRDIANAPSQPDMVVPTIGALLPYLT